MTYPGGKGGDGTYQKLINLMPPHATYIEPFLGGGAIMRMKRPAARNIGMDLSAQVVAQWKACTAKTGDGAGTIVRRGDGIHFLEAYRFSGDELVYCDPPYLVTTRKRITRSLYTHEMSDLEHLRLLRCIRTIRAMVMISGYQSAMYDQALGRWNKLTVQSATRRGPATECVWYNFPTPLELHDYRYLGDNFREREHIKRLKARWVARLERMPALKRQALLAAIAQR